MPDHCLSIVIPALNEEQAIGGTIERCLAAREHIVQAAGLDEVQIIVVSDGSTDRTAEIARGYGPVELIEFPANRGYGAAIKEGWRQSRGSLLGFLDADGTCDPMFFADLCRRQREASADIVLGSRLGPQSRMPRIRRIGNRFYALLLSLLCGRYVTDTASGMRVVRREALRHIYPLPDGLHFTPAMSARALLNDLRVEELPMRYEQRIGESKLNVVRDGVRFLHAILTGVLCYRPERLFLFAAIACVLVLILLAAGPTAFYAQNRRLEEWMIYRFVVCFVLGAFAFGLLLATALANRMAHFSPRRAEARSRWTDLIAAALRPSTLALTAAALTTAAAAFLWPGIVEYATTLTISLHWSRLMAGAFCLLMAFECVLFAVLLAIVAIWKAESTRGAGSP